MNRLIILFGSRARGTAGKNSDADIAVLADRPLTLAERYAAGERAAKQLRISPDKMDVIDLWNAPPLLAHQIGETGKLLEGAPSDFIRFRIRAWKQYLNAAKFRRAREQALQKYVQSHNS